MRIESEAEVIDRIARKACVMFWRKATDDNVGGEWSDTPPTEREAWKDVVKAVLEELNSGVES